MAIATRRARLSALVVTAVTCGALAVGSSVGASRVGAISPGHVSVSTGAQTRTSKPHFNPQAHKAALLALILRHNSFYPVSYFLIHAAPVDPTWVLFDISITVKEANGSSGQDPAHGFAHWSNSKWRLVIGPGSFGLCILNLEAVGIPAAVLHSFGKLLYCYP